MNIYTGLNNTVFSTISPDNISINNNSSINIDNYNDINKNKKHKINKCFISYA